VSAFNQHRTPPRQTVQSACCNEHTQSESYRKTLSFPTPTHYYPHYEVAKRQYTARAYNFSAVNSRCPCRCRLENTPVRYLSDYFGFPVGVVNGVTKANGGNLSVKELKLKSSIEDLQRQEVELKARLQAYHDLLADDVSVDVLEPEQEPELSREDELLAEIERIKNEPPPQYSGDYMLWKRLNENALYKAEHDLRVLRGEPIISFSEFSFRIREENRGKKIPVYNDFVLPTIPAVEPVPVQPVEVVNADAQYIKTVNPMQAPPEPVEPPKPPPPVARPITPIAPPVPTVPKSVANRDRADRIKAVRRNFSLQSKSTQNQIAQKSMETSLTELVKNDKDVEFE
jgi:hypothetical protein